MAALSGVLLGLALTAKFSAVFLVPVLVVLYLLRRWQQGGERVRPSPALALAAVFAIAFLVVLALYAPDGLPFGRGAGDRALVRGLKEFAAYAKAGNMSYLLGRQSPTGWWYCFPVAFAVKTPVATLLALWLALALKAARGRLTSALAWLRSAPFEGLMLVAPIAVFTPFVLASRINTGLRHLFPVYPFLFILISLGIMGRKWRFRRASCVLIAALLAAESLSVYPDYLAFFNLAAGGPGAGPRSLVDSNLDWGQDLKKLKVFMAARGIPKVCICYFGTALSEYYGLNADHIDEWPKVARGEPLCDFAAVSVTPLQGVYMPAEQFAFLRSRTLMAKVGYSIYVYDLRR